MTEQEEGERISFGTYGDSLRALSLDPAAACNEMGNYNSAGEIWYDLTSLAYLSDSTFIGLTRDQRAAIKALANGLKELPGDAMAPGGVMPVAHATCVIAMSHPAWIPFRDCAAKLLGSLAAEIRHNQDLLKAI